MTIRLRRAGWTILSVTVGLTLASCNTNSPSSSDVPSVTSEDTQGPIWFEEVTDAVGLDFVQDPGPTGDYFMPQANGSGCAFIHEKGNHGGKDNL
jgi:hypothetical protein